MNLHDALDAFLVQLVADGRAVHTRKQYGRHVMAFQRWLEQVGHPGTVEAIGHEDVARFLAAPAARLRPDGGVKRAGSVNALRGSLRGFFQFLHRAGLIPQNPSRLLRRAITGPPLPRALGAAEKERLLAALDEVPERDRVLFRTMLACGLRVGSAVTLDVRDVDLERGLIRLRSAKGDRDEDAVLPRTTQDLLRAYIGSRTSGPLFPGPGNRHLSVRHVQRLFSRVAATAGIGTTRTHALRHTLATDLYRRTGDLLVVKRALRHRSIESTVVYAHADDRRLRGVLDG